MKTWNLGAFLLLCGALAACSSDSGGDSSGSGGSGGSDGGGSSNDDDDDDDDDTGSGGGSGDGGSTGSSPTSTGSSPTSTGSSPTSTGSSPTSTGSLATSSSTGGGGEGVCETGLTFDEGGAVDTCIDTNCCAQFTTCAGADGANAEACNTCLMDGGGALCDAFLACTDTAGCFGAEGGGVCDTGLTFDEGGPADMCVDENCCTEFVACAGADGENAEACNACLTAEGGPLCDAFIGCANANCAG